MTESYSSTDMPLSLSNTSSDSWMVIALSVVCIALALSFCLLLGYLCRSRLNTIAEGVRTILYSSGPTQRRDYDTVAQQLWENGVETCMAGTMTVTLRDERFQDTEERIHMQIKINAIVEPPQPATGRNQRSGASADPGASMSPSRKAVALRFDLSQVHDPTYVQPSPSIVNSSHSFAPQFSPLETNFSSSVPEALNPAAIGPQLQQLPGQVPNGGYERPNIKRPRNARRTLSESSPMT